MFINLLRLNFIVLLLLVFNFQVKAQSNYLSSFSIESEDLQRWEALQTSLNSSSLPNKSWTEKAIQEDVKNYKITSGLPTTDWRSVDGSVFTGLDIINVNRLQNLHGIWYEDATGMPATKVSKKPILRYFYRSNVNFFDVYEDDFYLAVNPVLGLEAQVNNGQFGYKNFRGIEAKGRLFNKVGFYTRLGDNQLFLDDYTQDLVNKTESLYGYDYFVNYAENKYDLFEATAYLNFSIVDELVNLSVGYDRHFVGYGLRSLVIDEEGAAQLFANLQGRWKKWSYDFLYMELVDDYKQTGDQNLPKKYGQIHQINYDINERIRVGIFEKSIIPSNQAFNPLNIIPIPGLQSIMQNTVGKIQSEMGLQAKGIIAKGFTLYTQAFIKDYAWNQIGKRDYRNQWAAQLGFQYYDAFTIKNLDIQGEVNVVRPFAYSSSSVGKNYTHYNQPLAHPFGSGFMEAIGKVRYQFHPKWNVYGILSLARLNVENPVYNNGENPKDIINYSNKLTPYGEEVTILGNPYSNIQIYGKAWAQYEVIPKVFITGGAYSRHHWNNLSVRPIVKTISPFIGLNWHFVNRHLIY